MSPQECLAALDSALAANGEEFSLQRTTGPSSHVDVTCLAWVTAVTVEQIAAGIAETELNVIFSPTQINNAGWPGVASPKLAPFDEDQRIPRANIDKAIVQKRLRTVTFCNAVSVGGELVRINMRVAG